MEGALAVVPLHERIAPEVLEPAFVSQAAGVVSGGMPASGLPSSWQKKLDSGQVRAALRELQISTSNVSRAAKITRSPVFTVTMGVITAINAVYLGLETMLAPPGELYPGTSWYALEVIFSSIFLVELMLRLAAEGCIFWRDLWSAFDSILVLSTCVDTFIIQIITWGRGEAMDLLGVMRILRSFRVLRVFRLFRFYRKLWLLVIGVVDAMRALVWAWILIGIVIYVFAIVMTRALRDVPSPMTSEFFSTVPMSMFTLFQVMTLEGWPSIVRDAQKYEAWTVIFFVGFLMLTTFSVMNVIVAVIVESTMEKAQGSRSDTKQYREEELKKAATKIEEVFRKIDTASAGHITKAQFLEASKRDDVANYLQDVGVDTRQAENLFDILDFDDSGALDASEFTSGVLRSRGSSRARDLLCVQCALWRTEKALRSEVERLCRMAESRMCSVDAQVDRLQEDLQKVADRVGFRKSVPLAQMPEGTNL